MFLKRDVIYDGKLKVFSALFALKKLFVDPINRLCSEMLMNIIKSHAHCETSHGVTWSM